VNPLRVKSAVTGQHRALAKSRGRAVVAAPGREQHVRECEADDEYQSGERERPNLASRTRLRCCGILNGFHAQIIGPLGQGLEARSVHPEPTLVEPTGVALDRAEPEVTGRGSGSVPDRRLNELSQPMQVNHGESGVVTVRP
jgi:hypothetical protein